MIEQPAPEMTQDDDITGDVDRFLESKNIAEQLDDETLTLIGTKIVQYYEDDLDSRRNWEDNNDEWMKLATQVLEDKNTPWPNAANSKYPLLSTAALQFHARAYPALVNEPNLVKTKVVGDPDPQGIKRGKANRISQYMSYQVLEEMEHWQEDMDRLLYILPITGLAYKKTYYSPNRQTNVSELVLARDLVINYYATDFERARKTHRIELSRNELIEYQNMGIYMDIEIEDPDVRSHNGVEDEITGLTQTGDAESPHEILECHCWWDLDDDGYEEPYIITVDHDSQKVLRIVARYTSDNYKVSDNGDVMKITPTEYFTPYQFIPNPESKIYSIGFGSLLGPLNSSINTLLNQLTDAGTLSNMQGGFLAKGVRVRGGAIRFKPGQWIQVQSTGDDLRKGIFPMPVREPSSVLFNLLSLLIQSAENLASVKDIMVGDSPGQNQPYATTAAVLEQGMKVFVSIYKRIYRSLTQEYKKLFKLNSIYLDEKKYFNLLDTQAVMPIGRSDFDISSFDVIPGADPSIISEAHRMIKAQSLMEKLMAGFPLNPSMVLRRVLEAEGHEDIEELMQTEPPQPDFETQLKMQEFEHRRLMDAKEHELKVANTQYEAMKDYAQAVANLAKAQSTQVGTENNQVQSAIDVMAKQEQMLNERLQAIANLKQMEEADDMQEEESEGESSEK